MTTGTLDQRCQFIQLTFAERAFHFGSGAIRYMQLQWTGPLRPIVNHRPGTISKIEISRMLQVNFQFEYHHFGL
ncbi:hypothetical protein L0222_25960 [bacterium]|nr:hypothetical protein [bacterium]